MEGQSQKHHKLSANIRAVQRDGVGAIYVQKAKQVAGPDYGFYK